MRMAPRRPPNRDEELSTKAAIRKRLLEVFSQVEKGFSDQRERSDHQKDNWDLYNCKLTDRQFYNGNSQVFVSLIADAVDARQVRFTNQLFPTSGRYVTAITHDGEIPYAHMSLQEHYIRKANLRTNVIPSLFVNGDLEGQYSIYVSWEKSSRKVTRREEVADVKQKGMDPSAFVDLGTHKEYVTEEEVQGRPHVEVLHDADLLILPVTCDTLDEAIERGGSATVIRRWSKDRIRQAINDGDIVKEQGEVLIKTMERAETGNIKNPAKDLADAAGIRGAGKEAQIYETWVRLKIKGEKRLCRAYYGGDKVILGCKLSPYWCEKPPILTQPVKKVAGVLKGKAPVDKAVDWQILANDTINEGADTAHFSAMPIVMTDPEKNPRVSSMVLGLAAVWETDPKSTQFAQFPDLWRSAMERYLAIQQQVFQSLGVNPSMVPQSSGKPGAKRNQAEIAMEQQVDLLTTADAVTVIEEGILNPLLERFAEYDHQFREDPVTVEVFGMIGVNAQMEDVDPIQLNNRWVYKWYGVEAARNAAQFQQQTAFLNIVKSIPPQQYADYELDLTPVIQKGMEEHFGPRLAPLVFKKKQAFSLDPELENQMLAHGHVVPVQQADDDQAHIQAHMTAVQMEGGDPHGTFRDHINHHVEQMQKKAQAQMQQSMAQGLPGSPGGAGPGAAGTPKPGAQPGTGRGMKGPPGAIHADQMARAGATVMPRRAG